MPRTQGDGEFETSEKVLMKPAAGLTMAWLWSKPFHNKGSESARALPVLPLPHRVGGSDCT